MMKNHLSSYRKDTIIADIELIYIYIHTFYFTLLYSGVPLTNNHHYKPCDDTTSCLRYQNCPKSCRVLEQT